MSTQRIGTLSTILILYAQRMTLLSLNNINIMLQELSLIQDCPFARLY